MPHGVDLSSPFYYLTFLQLFCFFCFSLTLQKYQRINIYFIIDYSHPHYLFIFFRTCKGFQIRLSFCLTVIVSSIRFFNYLFYVSSIMRSSLYEKFAIFIHLSDQHVSIYCYTLFFRQDSRFFHKFFLSYAIFILHTV
jgi:hypothetical protein